eukprot:851752_1
MMLARDMFDVVNLLHAQEEEEVVNKPRRAHLKQIFRTFATDSFNVNQHLSQVFQKKPVDMAEAYKKELLVSKNEASDELKKYVTENYSLFINTSKEIVNMDTDMQNLHNHLSQYRDAMKAVRETTFDLSETRRSDDSNSAGARESGGGGEKRVVEGRDSGSADALQEIVDDLAGMIFERKFEQATATIEESLDRLKDLKEFKRVKIRKEIEERIAELVQLLTHELQSSTNLKSGESRITKLLIRLHKEDKALNIFLANRSQLIKNEIRHIKFQGDMSVYISDLSHVHKLQIEKASLDFRSLFYNNQMMSGFIVWAVDEIKHYGEIFQRQVFQTDTPHEKIGECLKHSFQMCKSLEGSGLQVQYVLEKMFFHSLQDILKNSYKTIHSQLESELENEEWTSTDMFVHTKVKKDKRGTVRDSKNIKVTSSAKALYNIIHRFIAALRQLLPQGLAGSLFKNLYASVTQGMLRLFEFYLLRLTSTTKKRHLSEAQSLSVIANVFYLQEDLLARVIAHFARVFGRKLGELDTFRAKAERLYIVQRQFFSQKFAPNWVSSILTWEDAPPEIYSRAVIDEANASPSPQFLRLYKHMSGLRSTIINSINEKSVKPIISRSILEVLNILSESSCWENLGDSSAATKPSFSVGHGGLQQFALDVRFLVHALRAYRSAEVEAQAAQLIQLAVDSYCRETSQSPTSSDILFDSGWFSSRISDALKDCESKWKVTKKHSFKESGARKKVRLIRRGSK